MSDALETLVTTELDSLGFDLVEFRRRGSRARPVLELRVERRDGAPPTVDDCAAISRAVEARLDATNVAGDRYVLEVSSPGIERRLRTPAEWRRFVGQPAVVTATTLPGGKAEVDLIDVAGEAGSEVARVRDAKGVIYDLPLAAVSEARLSFHWNR